MNFFLGATLAPAQPIHVPSGSFVRRADNGQKAKFVSDNARALASAAPYLRWPDIPYIGLPPVHDTSPGTSGYSAQCVGSSP
jgi:hypothetical protein